MAKNIKAKDIKQAPKKPSSRSRKFSRLKGMKDITFEEYKYHDLVVKKAIDLATTYGFRRIETPVLENEALFERSTGKTSDIVSKEMYTFVDKSGDKISLRPEATPGLVRAYNEHGMLNLPQPVKTLFIGSLFRHEKPQSGRLREHRQFDLEMFGEASPVADAQLMIIAYNFFRELQIDIQIQVNSIGCKECRGDYIKKLVAFYKERGKRTRLCNDCKKRLDKNPLRLLDCKEADCIEIRDDAPQLVDYLDDACREHFVKVLEYLDEFDIPYVLNPYLVRGLDYYNRTVFEFVSAPEENEEGETRRQVALGGGGRYDDLVETMGGREPTPALGFGIGLERVVMKIKELNIPLKKDDDDIIFLAQLGEPARKKTMVMFEELRRSGFKVRQAFTKDALKNQLEEANRVGAKYSIIIGQKEMLDETAMLRDMESGVQEIVDIKKVSQELQKRLKKD
ncbi:MAG: histidine--tRNA ligase [Patescibacteria group bacterium]|jgi:histidyl-tRNA synthetase|nr:histidine--tRNA ligase [Patescibacteria group bacterium]